MSWLEDLQREFKYECKSCKKTSIYGLKQDGYDYRQPQKCVHCGAQAEYAGFNPIKMFLRGKVAIERNGVKGYMHTDGRGNVRYTSASKERYMETGDIVPQYTPQLAEHLAKTGNGDRLKEVSRAEIIDQRKKNKEISKLAKPVMAIPADV